MPGRIISLAGFGLQIHPPKQVVEARVTHISKAGADTGTDRSFAWAFDILILAL